MSETTYRGDSDGKRWSRFQWWRQALICIGEERFLNGRHLVLASRVGGDISVLLALGVRAEKIVAVDRERSAVEACREKYPSVTCVHGDIDNVARAYGRVFDVALVDLCGQATTETVRLLSRIVSFGMRDGGIFGWSVMSGREAPHRMSVIDGARRFYDAAMERAGLERRADKHTTRNVFLAIGLRRELLPRRIAVLPFTDWQYQSSTRESVGVPMTMAISIVVRALPGTSLNAFRRLLFRRFDEAGEKVREFTVSGKLRNQDSAEEILRLADVLDGHTAPTAALLNIAPGQLAARRAWRTRKTATEATP